MLRFTFSRRRTIAYPVPRPSKYFRYPSTPHIRVAHLFIAAHSCPPTQYTHPPHREGPRTEPRPKALLHDPNHGFLRSCSRTQGRPGGRGVARRRRCRNGKSSENPCKLFTYLPKSVRTGTVPEVREHVCAPEPAQVLLDLAVCRLCCGISAHTTHAHAAEKSFLVATKASPAGWAGRWVSFVESSILAVRIVVVRRTGVNSSKRMSVVRYE